MANWHSYVPEPYTRKDNTLKFVIGVLLIALVALGATAWS